MAPEKKVFAYDYSHPGHEGNNEYIGEKFCTLSPLEPGKWLVPAGTTEKAPPVVEEGYKPVFNEEIDDWVTVADLRDKQYIHCDNLHWSGKVKSIGPLPDGAIEYNSEVQSRLNNDEIFRRKHGGGVEWIKRTFTNEEIGQKRMEQYAMRTDPLHAERLRKVAIDEWADEDQINYQQKLRETTADIKARYPYNGQTTGE